MTGGVFVQATGIATPAPGDQDQQIEALLSGAPLFQRHPVWIGGDGQSQIMGFVAQLRDLSGFPARLAALLHIAFSDCRRDQAHRTGQIVEAPMIVALPDILRHATFTDDFRAAAAALDLSGVTEVHLQFGGAASALSLLQQDPASPRYLAAADSLVTPFMLDFLAAQELGRDRLHPWNPIPAEGSACLLVSPDPGVARVSAVALARETERLTDGQRGLLGRGLCTAIDAAIGAGPMTFDTVFSDASGERWRAEELGIIKTERPALNIDDMRWHQISRAVGDLGTATSLVSVAVACRRASGTMVLSSERRGGRAVAIIEPARRPGA